MDDSEYSHQTFNVQASNTITPGWWVLLGTLYCAGCRLVLGPLVLAPLASLVGLPHHRAPPPPPNPALEALYQRHHRRPPLAALLRTTMATGLTMRQLDYWLRQRDISQRPSTRHDFVEFGVRAACHTLPLTCGVCGVLTGPWKWPILSQPNPCVLMALALATYLHTSVVELVMTRACGWGALHQPFLAGVVAVSWAWEGGRVGSLVVLLHQIATLSYLLANIARLASGNNEKETVKERHLKAQ